MFSKHPKMHHGRKSMTLKEVEEKVQEYQCIHCGQCEKGLPCPQDLKRFKIWQEYFDSHEESK